MLLTWFPGWELPNAQELTGEIHVQQFKMPLDTMPIMFIPPPCTTQTQITLIDVTNPPEWHISYIYKTEHKARANIDKIKDEKSTLKATITNRFLYWVDVVWDNLTQIKTIINWFEVHVVGVFNATINKIYIGW